MNYDQLTTGEAARISGLSVATIKRKIQANELKASRSQSGTWVVSHAELMAFLSAQKPPTRPDGRRPTKAQVTSEPLKSRDAERFERELSELKEAKIRLENRITKLEEEKHALEQEYKAFIKNQLEEKEKELKLFKEEKSSCSRFSESRKFGKNEVSGVPSRFLQKLISAAKTFQEA